ncbi:hypothetical protein LTS10_010738 [Elasticomyces elasticus]|nr:hypothetical protein LTS10_010738 [Elasticomyces elasticus]
MHYSIDNTAWMSPIRPELKKLMAEFFAIADKPDPEAGNLWAERVFTPEGRIIAGGQEIAGESAIRNSRKAVWGAIKARKHVVERAYGGGPSGEDIMVHGRMTATVASSGTDVSVPFAARFLVDAESLEKSEPKLLSYQGWADSSPLAAALRGE